MKRFTLMTVMLMSVAFSYAKTLVLYYSFTNNSQTIAYNFVDITGADIQEIEPSEEGLDYAANNYAIGRMLMNAINSNPNSEASYPAIKDVNCNLADYSTIIYCRTCLVCTNGCAYADISFQTWRGNGGERHRSYGIERKQRHKRRGFRRKASCAGRELFQRKPLDSFLPDFQFKKHD